RDLASHWPLGLASSSPRKLIDTVLEYSGLSGYFESTVSTDEVPRGKPSPDVYLEVASRMEKSPRLSIAIEDSSNGVRSATAAGYRCIAVHQTRYPLDDDASHKATIVLNSLQDLGPKIIESVGLQ
ncbi:MAG TPA: HAD-IA family hydrolase, partial [Acidimicrobiales bacterium]|nr:HAD-IA family hydrolase [Acidimicrobiales bacterium]